MKINETMRGQLPRVAEPVALDHARLGRHGWKVTIPGGRPLATPAVEGGRVFLGGGFGSYDFYAFDALTGRLAWQYQTEDDGPTAAVVVEERVVFNTESCELEVLTVEGRRVWKKWLGDPLLSMPAVAGGRIFMVYPASRTDRRHYLACFDLHAGHEYWNRPIAGEIITCPVLADDEVYLTSLDGTMACFRQSDGEPVWNEPRNATSAPAVWQRQCYFSQRHEMPAPEAISSEKAYEYAAQQMESLSSKLSAPGTPVQTYEDTVSHADYLDHDKRQRRSPHYKMHAMYDGAVGFGGSKGDSKIDQAMRNLGTAHVSGVWAFQGSKPFLHDGRLYSSIGDTLHCVDPQSRDVHWKRKLREEADQTELLDTLLTPPALVNGKIFLGTLDGRVLCLSDLTGDELWSARIGEPVVFQPAVVAGRLYVATHAGSLFCLETGDPNDDGWHMWGATPAHNGLVEMAMV